MSTEGANKGSRWLPRLIGVLLLLMGLALLAGGIKLSQLGGSLYYLIAGIGFAVSGALLLAQRRIGLGVYAVVLLGSTVWALLEVGLDWWQLVPASGHLVRHRCSAVAALVAPSVDRASQQSQHGPAHRCRGGIGCLRRRQSVHPPR